MRIMLRDGIASAAMYHTRLVRTLFACANRFAEFPIHREIGGRHAAPRGLPADRARNRLFKVAQACPFGEFAMAAALVVVEGHSIQTCLRRRRISRAAPPLMRQRARARSTFAESTCFCGPPPFGWMSKSNMSVGKATDTQAFGMSTTPPMRPSTGAQPRIT